jgi:hypothetical protein
MKMPELAIEPKRRIETGYLDQGDVRRIPTNYQYSYGNYKVAKPSEAHSQKVITEDPSPKAARDKAVYFRAGKTDRGEQKFVFTANGDRITNQRRQQDVAAVVEHVQVPLRSPARLPIPRQAPRRTIALEAFAKHMKHLEYLVRVSTGERALISRQTALLARHAWRIIWLSSGGKIPIPAACTGPDGEMFYSWDRGRHHLELEIIPGQPSEFFYRDRETEQFWGEDYNVGDPLPDKVVEALPLFQ